MEKEKKAAAPVSFDEFKAPSYEEWKQAATAALKGAPFEKRMFTPTYEGIALEPIYTMDSVKALSDCRAFPGGQDYLRGTKSAPGNDNIWKIAQGVDDRCPGCAGEAIAHELDKGATAIHPVFDWATTHGADAPVGAGRGVSVSALSHAEKLFAHADPTRHELHAFAGASALPLLGLVNAWAKKNGKDAADLKGCLGADPVSTLARDGKLPRPLSKLFDEMARTIKWCEKNACPLRVVLVRGSVYAAAGASRVQEAACELAVAAEVVRAMAERGIDPEVTCRRIRFEVTLGANFFMEIAALRALRVMWARVAEEFGCDGEGAKINVIAQTSPFTVTTYDPYVNILRASTQAFSGAVGGVDAMQVLPFDEAIRPATEQSKRIARNQQIMLQTEFNFEATVDPAGGSWYVETLTRQVEDKAWALFQKIEAAGGMSKALEAGLVQDDIDAVLADRFKKLATRADRAVGNNMYANMAETPLDAPADDAADFAAKRAEKLAAAKAERDAKAVEEALGDVADGGCPNCVAAAFAAGATLSEVWAALGDEPCCEVKPLEPHRWTEQYEALRRRTEEYTAKTGGNVKVFLANLGPIPQHKPRADFSTGFFEVAHFEVLKNNGFPTPEEAAAAAAKSGADVAVICSTDATYPELVPPTAKLIKEKCPNMTVFLAGAPAPEFKQAYLDAGVDDFIHVKANCLQVLTALQQKKGMC